MSIREKAFLRGSQSSVVGSYYGTGWDFSQDYIGIGYCADTPSSLEGNTECPGTASSENLLTSGTRQESRIPCLVWKGFPAFPAHLRMRPSSRGNSRPATWVVTHAERPRFPGPLLRRTRGPDPSSKATLWLKAQHEEALPPPCIVRKDPRVRHTARRRA